jgi:hypothetical protein
MDAVCVATVSVSHRKIQFNPARRTACVPFKQNHYPEYKEQQEIETGNGCAVPVTKTMI